MKSQFPIQEGHRVVALDGVNKGDFGVVLYLPDLDGPWYEIQKDDGEVIVAYNVEHAYIAELAVKLAGGKTESQQP